MAVIVGNMVLWHPLLCFFFEKVSTLFTPLYTFVSSRRGSFKNPSSTSDGNVQTAVDTEARSSRDEVVREFKGCVSLEENETV